MTGGELVGFIAIVVGGMSWAVGWWLENVRQTTRRYRHSVVKMRIADHRNADGIDLRQIPKGKSHVILWFKPKVHLEVVGYDVCFVAGAGEEEDVPRVSPDVLRVTRAMIADDTEQSIWPAPIDDGHGLPLVRSSRPKPQGGRRILSISDYVKVPLRERVQTIETAKSNRPNF